MVDLHSRSEDPLCGVLIGLCDLSHQGKAAETIQVAIAPVSWSSAAAAGRLQDTGVMGRG